MPHIYEQSSGKWFGPTGELWGQGWSGQDAGRNNPQAQSIPDVGPIPQGWYTIGPAYDHTPSHGYSKNLGPLVMDLLPDTSNQMFGRSEFRIHGFGADTVHASEGCVIQLKTVREKVDLSPDRKLHVVEEVAGNGNDSDLASSLTQPPEQGQ